jgi:exopolyphosphatase / guanosine-5'-triphosphate,3'-diphosphate pyrophosphatase
MSPTSYLTAPPRGVTYEFIHRPAERQRGRRAASVPPMRVAVVDLGTNTTRLLVADVSDGVLTELDKQTTITRLGQGVDATGRLADEAMDRVRDTLSRYRQVMDREGVAETIAVATSAMRDASNGPAFRDELADRYGIDARTISGDEEARLTFLGATSGRTPAAESPSPTMVIDIGGGSTEYVVGSPNAAPDFHISTQMGSVRHTERFLVSDPPKHEELEALAEDVHRIIDEHVPGEYREETAEGIAVAGTATTLAAIDQELDPYDPAKVHGYRVSLAAAERIQAMLAALPVEERRGVTGLHPDRAPTIVAGVTILVESIRSFGLAEIEVSEADILQGAAMAAADGQVSP